MEADIVMEDGISGGHWCFFPSDFIGLIVNGLVILASCGLVDWKFPYGLIGLFTLSFSFSFQWIDRRVSWTALH